MLIQRTKKMDVVTPFCGRPFCMKNTKKSVCFARHCKEAIFVHGKVTNIFWISLLSQANEKHFNQFLLSWQSIRVSVVASYLNQWRLLNFTRWKSVPVPTLTDHLVYANKERRRKTNSTFIFMMSHNKHKARPCDLHY